MNSNKALIVSIGIGIILYSLVSYLWFKSLLGIFNCSLGVMIFIFVLYNENKKIGYLMALFGVNVFQWLFLIYVFFNNLIYIKTNFYYILIGAPFFTLVLVNQIRKNHLKSAEKAKINILKDKKGLMLLVMGVVITIGCLACFMVYYAPIFLYGVTLGLMVIICGFYSKNRKVNVSTNYAQIMGSLFMLQWFIIGYFISTHQFSGDDFVNSVSFSIMITLFFYIQIRESDLKYIGRMRENPRVISNQKKENIIGIFAVVLFIIIFGALILKGYF